MLIESSKLIVRSTWIFECEIIFNGFILFSWLSTILSKCLNLCWNWGDFGHSKIINDFT